MTLRAEASADGVTWDDLVPGLGQRIQAGKKSWIVRYRVAGVQRQKTLPGTLRRADARKQATAIRAAAVEGKDRVAEGRATAAERRKAELEERGRRERRLGKLVDLYLEALAAGPLPGKKKRLAPRTVTEIRRYLRDVWKPLHEHDAQTLDSRTVSARLARVRAQRGATASLRALAYLSTCLSYGMSIHLLTRNVAFEVTKPAAENVRDRALADQELITVWNAADPATDYGSILRLLILTGQRREEVGGMRWSELNLAKRTWSLPGNRTKNKRPHLVPLSTQAMAILTDRTRSEGSTHVFGRDDTGFSGWSKSKERLDKVLGDSVAQWWLHDLRRSCVTGMCEIGVAPHVVEAIVNHISGHKAGVAGVYNRATYAEEKAKALQRWADHVEELVRGERIGNVVAFGR